MISTVSLSFDLTYVDPGTGAITPKGIVTDSTDYVGLGLTPSTYELKGLGQITFNGDLIEDFNIVGSPMIDLEIGDSTFLFDLPLDSNGNVANGVYTLQYSLRVSSQLTDTPITATPPSLVTVVSNQWISNFLESNDSINVVDTFAGSEAVTVQSAIQVGADAEITVSNYAISLPDYITFDITHLQLSGVYTYSGCTQTTADVSFTYDCEYEDSGTWAVANSTQLASNEIVTDLSCTISYPSWTAVNPNFNPQILTTSLPYPTLPNSTPLATGTYSVSLTEQIQQTQTDGLIILYSRSVIKEFTVSCAGTLCGLIPCIENLRAAHHLELVRNKVSKYQVYVDNVLLYYTEALNYKACGELDKYKETIAKIQASLDASGCECACCDDETYYWVSNNSATSVIDSLLQSFQFRLFNLTPPGPGSPLGTDDITKGVEVGALWENVNTGIIYRCTVNTANNATWTVYYTPGGGLTPSNGLSTVGSNVVLGGALTGNTNINTTSYNFKVVTASNVTPLLAESGGTAPTVSVLKTSSLPSWPLNETLRARATTSSAQNNFGAISSVYLSDVTGTESFASFALTSWVDSTNKDSTYELGTSDGGNTSTRFAILPDGQIRFNNYSTASFVDPSPAYTLGVDASGNVVQAPAVSGGPLVYVSKITQTGSTPPVETIIANTTGATFTWSVVVSGVYKITASLPVFTTNKTAIYVTPSSSGAYIMMANTSSTTECIVTSSNAFGLGGYTDGLINGATVKIEIYP